MFQPTIISTVSQSDDRIIIRLLMSRNKRNDYRLNWNSFKWKQTRRRLIRKERCLAIHGSRYFEKRSTSLFGECCFNPMVNVMVNVLRRVKGWPALHALASLCLWLLDDGVRMGEVQLWCRHGTAPMHIIAFQFIFHLPIPTSAVDQAIPLTSSCIFSDKTLCSRRLENKVDPLKDECISQHFEMIMIARTTMTIIDPHIIWREWPRKSGQKGVGQFLRCSQIVLCSWQL